MTVPSLYVAWTKPAFSPNLMNAILTSELTFSARSEILHLVGFGSKGGCSVGGSCSPESPQDPPPPTEVMIVQSTRPV